MKIYDIKLSGHWDEPQSGPLWRWTGQAVAPAAVRGVAMLEEKGRLRVAAAGLDGASRLPIELVAVPLDDGTCQVIFTVGRTGGLLRTMVEMKSCTDIASLFSFDLCDMRTATPGFFCTFSGREHLRFGAAFVGEKYRMASETGPFETEMVSRAMAMSG